MELIILINGTIIINVTKLSILNIFFVLLINSGKILFGTTRIYAGMSNAIYELNKTRIYVWMKYNSVEHRTYKWNRYNVVTTVTYKWNKFNCNSTRIYRWNRYNLSTTYRWKRCAASGEKQTQYDYIDMNEPVTIARTSTKPNFDGNKIVLNTFYQWTSYSSDLITSLNIPYFMTYYWVYVNRYYTDSSWEYGADDEYVYGYYPPIPNGQNIVKKITKLEDDSLPCHVRWYRSDGGKFTYVTYSYSPDTSNFTYVTSSNASQYPNGGTSGSYYYFDRETIYSQGSAAGSVTSTSSSAYPSNGQSGDYWYVSNGSYLSYSKGSANGSVTSTNQSAYPSNGRHSDGYWYESNGSSTSYSKGAANGAVTSKESDTYPSDGKSGNYWYTANGYDSTYSRGTKVGTVNNKTADAYPNNKRHTDGFWYVKLI